MVANARVVSVERVLTIVLLQSGNGYPSEGGNGIPTPKCIPSGKGKFKMSWYAYCKPY